MAWKLWTVNKGQITSYDTTNAKNVTVSEGHTVDESTMEAKYERRTSGRTIEMTRGAVDLINLCPATRANDEIDEAT